RDAEGGPSSAVGEGGGVPEPLPEHVGAARDAPGGGLAGRGAEAEAPARGVGGAGGGDAGAEGVLGVRGRRGGEEQGREHAGGGEGAEVGGGHGEAGAEEAGADAGDGWARGSAPDHSPMTALPRGASRRSRSERTPVQSVEPALRRSLLPASVEASALVRLAKGRL